MDDRVFCSRLFRSLAWCAFALSACSEPSAETSWRGAVGDPCRRSCFAPDAGTETDAGTDAGNNACGSACLPSDAGLDADTGPHASEVVHKDACRHSVERVYDLCLWVDPRQLANLKANPNEDREIKAEVSLAGERFAGVELELHGGTARTFEKKSYRVRFSREQPLFDFFGDGAENQERLVLQASWIDPSFVRAKLVFDALRGLDALAPRVSHARLWINGEQAGLYAIIERVDEHFLERNGLSRDGNLYKAENHDANFGMHERPLDGFSERTHEDGRADDLAELFASVRDTPLDHEDFERDIFSRIDMADFMWWNVVMSFALNLDTFDKNYYLYHDPAADSAAHGQVFRIIHWDADATLGLWWNGKRAADPAADWLWGDQNVLARRTFAIDAYRDELFARYALALESALGPDQLIERATTLLDELEPALRDELALWPRGEGYDAERAFLLEMIELRAQVIRGAVPGGPDEVLGVD